MKQTEKSGNRTLLWSVIMSSPGPLVVGAGLLVGRSATQIADFVRRSAELLAIIVSFLVYRHTTGDRFDNEEARKVLERRTNRFVGGAMCLGGSMMLLLAAFSGNEDTGNVIPGLCIALLGVVANCIFWIRYSRLGRQSGNSILLVQSRLYRAKTLVDGCVTIALLSVVFFPGTAVSWYLDKIGSVIVALYLIRTGIGTISDK
ncbi:MAG: cation transporter [Oscillospiraceae bacterium]|nr:cation transporter [Oscillospiraceae bacterium]